MCSHPRGVRDLQSGSIPAYDNIAAYSSTGRRSATLAVIEHISTHVKQNLVGLFEKMAYRDQVMQTMVEGKVHAARFENTA